jgi:hypothetical protein
MALAKRVACDEEGDGKGCKRDGNEGDGRASATKKRKEEGECAAYSQDALIKAVSTDLFSGNIKI